MTHAYKQRVGVRHLSSGVKVYYIPGWLVVDQVSLPTLYGFFPLLRNIFLREDIQIVHGHQAFSALAHEALLHAKTMGLKACFTDHSLFGFEDTGSILTNKLLKFTLSDIDHVICVSHTSKENTALRGSLNPRDISVIPNAVVASEFTPDPSKRPTYKSTLFTIKSEFRILTGICYHCSSNRRCKSARLSKRHRLTDCSHSTALRHVSKYHISHWCGIIS